MKNSGLLITTLLIFALYGCGSAEERKAAYLDKAEQALEAGNLEKARIDLKNVLQIDPKDARAYFKLGNIFERQKEYKQAYASYNSAVQLDPDNLEYQSKIGRFHLLLANDIEKASEKMNLALSQDKYNINGILLKAGILVRQGKTKEAKKVSVTLFENHPESIENALFLSKLYSNEKQYSDAISVLEKSKNLNPGSQLLLTKLADVHFINKDFNKAGAILTSLVKIHPDVLQNYFELAKFYSKINELEKAEETLRSAILADEQDVKRKEALVGFIRRSKGNDRAIKELESLIQSNPKESVYRLALAEVQLAKNDTDSAISIYKTIIKEFSEDGAGVSSRVQLANIYMLNEDEPSASSIIDEASEIAPNDSEVNLVKAKIALYNKNSEQAIIALRTVLKDNPEKLEAYILLSASHKANKEDDMANLVINQAYKNNQSNIKVLLPLATYHLQNKNAGEAEKIIDSYLRLDTDNYEALSIKSGILNSNKKYTEAFEIAERMINQFPDMEDGYVQSVPALLANKKVEKAIGLLSTGYQKSNSTKILKIKAQLLLSEKKVNEAIKALNVATEKDADGSIHLLLAKAYMANKDMDSAENILLKSIKRNESLTEPYMVLAKIYFLDKNAKQAMSILNEGYQKTNAVEILKLKVQMLISSGKVNDAITEFSALTVKDKDGSIHLFLAEAYMANKDIDSVKKTLVNSIKQDDSRTDSYIGLSSVYSSENNTDQAIKILKDGVNANPNDLKLTIMLATLYAKNAKIEAATQVYESFLVDNSDNLLVNNNLAALLSEHRTDSKSLSRAKELADKMKEAEQPVIRDTVGWVYYKFGKYSDAITVLKSVVEDAPDQAIFNFHLGMAYYKKNDKDSARTYLSKAVKSESDFTGRNEAEELLKSL